MVVIKPSTASGSDVDGDALNRVVAGVELGGTKCVVTVAISPDRVLAQHVIPTTSPENTLSAIEDALRALTRATGAEALGIASFGPLDLDPCSPSYGSISSTPKQGWRDTELLHRLARCVDLPAVIDTDVNGAALAETRWGAGRGLLDFAYITVGTGIGVGLIVNGSATRGFGHCELGHIRTSRLAGDAWPGSCPYHGDCVEGLASGSAIAARIAGRDVSQLTADDEIWAAVAYTIAQLCHVIVCASAPRKIVIGGGVIDRHPHLLSKIESILRGSLAGYIDLPRRERYIGAPGLGDMAGPLGPVAMAQASS